MNDKVEEINLNIKNIHFENYLDESGETFSNVFNY
jgi:hypothetical protein